jgi:hypothetical protein
LTKPAGQRQPLKNFPTHVGVVRSTAPSICLTR